MAAHNFDLSEEQAMIRDTVRSFADDVAGPKALELDEHRQFAGVHFGGLTELGLLGVLVGEDHGGMGLGYLSFAIAVEELARGCGSTARLLVNQAGQCGMALEGLDGAGDALEAILGGQTIAAWVDPHDGIGAGESGGLSGTAPLVIPGAEASLFVVAARNGDEPVLGFVPGDAVVRSPAESLGFRSGAPATVGFEDSEASIVARGDAARTAIDRALLAGRIGDAAAAVGTAESSIELAKTHAGERIAFGKPLAKQQAVQHKLVECHRRTAAARHLVIHAARLADAGEDARSAAILAKLTAIEAAVFTADEAIQIHGGYGYTVEYHVERHYRDMLTLQQLGRDPVSLRDDLVASL